MTGVFEHLAQFDDSERVAGRKAAAVANKRVQDFLGDFIHKASDETERNARLALVEEDVATIVASVVDEYGGDHDNILATVRERVAGPLGEPSGEFGFQDPNSVADSGPVPLGNPCENCGQSLDPNSPACQACGYDPEAEAERRYFDQRDPGNLYDIRGFGDDGGHGYGGGDPDDGYYGSTREARRPKMCPYHSELVDASLQAQEPQYAAFSGLVGGPSHCKGGFEGGCNFRPEMVTSEYWDSKKQEADARAKQRELDRAETPVNPIPEAGEPSPVDEGDGITDVDQQLSEAPSAVGEGVNESFPAEPAMAMAASRKVAKLCPECEEAEMTEDDHALICPKCGHEEAAGSDSHESSMKVADADRDGGGAVKREDLPKNTGDATTDEPSPKTDHTTWKPNALNDSGNVKPIDSEQSGSPHPTERQDVTDKADHQKDFLEQTEAVTDKQDLPTADESGQSTERNIEQPHTDTFNNDGQASPVTNEVAEAILSRRLGFELRAGFSVEPMTPEHAERLQVCDPSATGREAFAVVDDKGVAHAAFDPQTEVGWGSTAPKPEYQNVIDRTKPHVYPEQDVSERPPAFAAAQDPDKNPVREILESGFPTHSEVQSALAKFRASNE